jgi:hypothetical protein
MRRSIALQPRDFQASFPEKREDEPFDEGYIFAEEKRKVGSPCIAKEHEGLHTFSDEEESNPFVV